MKFITQAQRICRQTHIERRQFVADTQVGSKHSRARECPNSTTILDPQYQLVPCAEFVIISPDLANSLHAKQSIMWDY